jgi:hypothetical protein
MFKKPTTTYGLDPRTLCSALKDIHTYRTVVFDGKQSGTASNCLESQMYTGSKLSVLNWQLQGAQLGQYAIESKGENQPVILERALRRCRFKPAAARLTPNNAAKTTQNLIAERANPDSH